MPWLTDLASLLGPSEGEAGAGPLGPEDRPAEKELERFLQRLNHPAGRADVPVEPPAGQAAA